MGTLQMIELNRTVDHGEYRLADIFPDIQQHAFLLEIFETEEEKEDILRKTVVLISDQPHYMKVDNDQGSILINPDHLRHSDVVILYLDIVHELVHVKQHRQGLNLYDRTKAYVDRQTEIDAYAFTVKEARRIGLTDRQIFDYLCVEWITPEEHLRLAKKLNLNV